MENILYVTDLDGTLLNRNDRISEYSCKMINKLVEKGMLFTYATARSLTSASVVTKGLLMKNPVVGYNGAFIFEPEMGKILHSVSFTQKEREAVVELLERFQLSPFVYSLMDGKEKVTWLKGKENEGMKRYLSLRKGDRRLNPLSDTAGLFEGEVFYFTLIGEKSELKTFYEEIQELGGYRCTLQQELYRTEFWCEVMPAMASKANGIKILKKLLHCDRVISFGDTINDIPMFQISDECYAVENAVDELKQLATGVIASNEKNGVAEWLYQNVQNYNGHFWH